MDTDDGELFKTYLAQLESGLDLLQEGLVFLDSDRNIVRINRAAAALLGLEPRPYSHSEVYETFEVLLPTGGHLPHDQWPAIKALRGEFSRDTELIIRRRDTGATEIVAISTAPVQGISGFVDQVVVSYRDISAPQSLAQARAVLADIVESSEDAIIGKDLNGVVTTWNRGAEKIFGYSAAEMIGESIYRLLPPGGESQEDEILGRIRRGEIVKHMEAERITKGGRHIFVSLTISPIRNTSGTIVGASKIARDVTERRLLEQQLKQSQKMEAIGQLTGGIAHDFNNLLAVVVGNLDLLERLVADNETALKRVRSAQRGALRGADLTRRLLAFSSKGKIEPTDVSIAECVSNLLEFASRMVGPEIKITTRIDPGLPPIHVDAGYFESSLLNLVVNARDAMAGAGSLTVTTERRRLEPNYPPVVTGELKAGDYACVCVSDTGCGMSKEILDRVFEPFFTTKGRDRGTGLGLAMVYGFVKQSGGTVRIYSEPGYGTAVSLYLPLASPAAKATPMISSMVSAPRRVGSVLLVDDEEELLEIASTYLEEMGFTVHQAKNGAEALQLFISEPEIGLIITDVIMPGGMSGVDLAQRVRHARPEVIVMYCSGFPIDALAERSMPLIDGPILQKPYQRHEFRKFVEEATSSDSDDHASS